MGFFILPHKFRPLHWTEWVRKNGRCRLCLFPREGHPIRNFQPYVRTLGDKRRLTQEEAMRLELQRNKKPLDTAEEQE